MSPITVNGPHQSGSATPSAGSVSGAADKSSASTQTFTGNVEAPAFIADGLTGSVAASRYVGATATGAPASGAHLLGDYVITQDGHVFICTVAGTPGTWRDVNVAATAADLASASAQTFTGNVGTPAVVVSGLTGAVQASRYAGATTSGAPTTGAHLLGDVVIGQDGVVWVCITAGTPGTWQPQIIGACPFPGTNVAATGHPLAATSATPLGGANALIAVRVTIPKTGTIADFSYYVKTTVAGNVDCGIYSTAGTRALLWSSGSTAIGGAVAWQSMGNPALAVQAGAQYDFAISMDTVTTVTFAALPAITQNAVAVLPTNYLPSGGASPKLNWTKATSFPLATNAATVVEGSCGPTTLIPLLIARIA